MSAFINNVAATVILIPAVISLARGAQASPSKLLIPLSFGSLLGGLTTLIGTPPNLLSAEALRSAGLEPFGMFDFLPTGAAVLGVGLLYLLTIGRRLLPDRPGPDAAREVEQTREYLAELVVAGDSSAVGKQLQELRWQRRFGVGVAEIVREGRRNRFPSATDVIYIDDLLLVEGDDDAVLNLAESEGLEFVAERKSADSLVDDDEATVLELVAGPSFAGAGSTVRRMNFRARYGGLVLGIWRQGQRIRRSIGTVAMRPGDVMLVRMPTARIGELAESRNFIVLEQRPRAVRPKPRMLVAVAILGVMVGLAAAGVAHISVTATLGVFLMLAARVIPYQRLYQVVEWRILVLIGSMIPLGTAMQTSGLARFVADFVTSNIEFAGPVALLAAIFVLTAVLTQIMSNAAAVVLVAPIALQIAADFEISPYPVMMMVAISASTAFLTPIGHQANVLVYNSGGYRFADFLKVGGPLTLLILLVSLAVVPIVWPLS
jgi:di/tricarboxylate transporter